MTELEFPHLSLGLAAPLLGALILHVRKQLAAKYSRVVGAAACGISLALFSLASVGTTDGVVQGDSWAAGLLAVDALDALPLVLFAALSLTTLLASPKGDVSGRSAAGVLLLLAGTSLAYAAASLPMMAAGWWLTLAPWATKAFAPRSDRLALAAQALGCIALTAAAGLAGFGEGDLERIRPLAFGLLLAAVLLRKGVFPFHSWVLDAYDRGPILANALLYNGHLGAMVLLRAESTGLGEEAASLLEWASIGALATAVFASVAAISQRRPRRILALVSLSQASFVLAGLGSLNVEGVAGSLVHWVVVALGTTVLACVLRALEVRSSEVGDGIGHLGLAARAPRLAVFFLVGGLSLVGLPGTLGYCAEDLLFHGALEDHPLLGVSLLLATALNAIHLLRLYTHLFLGRPLRETTPVPDALPRERWALSGCVAVLVVAGLFPAKLIGWRVATAERLTSTVEANEKAGGAH